MKIFLESITNNEELEEKIKYTVEHPDNVHLNILCENIKNYLLNVPNIKPSIKILQKYPSFNKKFIDYTIKNVFSQPINDIKNGYEIKKLLSKSPEYFYEGAKKRFEVLCGL
jgi:hypothetical protein